MSKIRTGITTEEEFRRIINEKGGNLKIDSTPEDVVREISNTGSAISFGSPFTEILKSVNDESPLDPIVIEGEDITDNFEKEIRIDKVDVIVSSYEGNYNVYVDTRRTDVSDGVIAVAFLYEGQIDSDIEYVAGRDHDVNTPLVFNEGDYNGIGVMLLPLKTDVSVDYQDGTLDNVFVDWVTSVPVSDEPGAPKTLAVKLSAAEEPTISTTNKMTLEIVDVESRTFNIEGLMEGGQVFSNFLTDDDTNLEIVIKESRY